VVFLLFYNKENNARERESKNDEVKEGKALLGLKRKNTREAKGKGKGAFLTSFKG
jgi:hypothetical protein